MAELREGQTGTAPDGTRVIVRNGQIVPVETSVSSSGAAAAGFEDLGDGWYRAPDGGTFQRNRQGQLIRRTGTAGGDEASTRNARKDFEGLAGVKDFRDTYAAFNSIASASRDETGASDMAMVMALNKLLDPGSVVREGEYDRALQVGGLRDRLAGYASKIASGEFLTPRVRTELLNTAQGLYEVRRDIYNDTADRYQDIARDDGLDPLNVARQEFRGQRITANPDVQEMGQANISQVEARPDNYSRQAPLGSPQRPYVLSPGVTVEQLPAGSSYIDTSGQLVTPNGPGAPASGPDTAIDYTDPANREALGLIVANGGWLRNGNGEPYQVPPGAAQFANPAGGDREVALGVFERAQARSADVENMSSAEAVADLRKQGAFERNVTAGMRGVVDGVTFGFSDEIGAGIDAAIGYGPGESFGDRYQNSVDRYRAVADADNEDVMAARRLGQGVGMIGGGLGAARAVVSTVGRVAPGLVRLQPAIPGATRGQNALRQAGNVGRVAAGGSAAGGVAGAGYSEGGLEQRAGNALQGAAVGAVVAPAVGGVANALAPAAIRGVQSANRFVGRQVGGAMEQAGIPGGSALSARAAAPNPLQSGMELLRTKTSNEPNALLANAQGFRDNGIEPNFFMAADDGTQATGRALATRQTPGRTRAIEFGRETRVGAQDRVSEIARRNISDDPRSATQVSGDLAEQQQTLSAEAMGPLRGEMVTLSPETATVFRTPGGRQAIEQARRWAANSQQGEELAALSRLADDALDQPGQIQISLGTMDRLRRSLRNQGQTAVRAADGDSAQGLGGLERQVRGDATAAVPRYDTFLRDYADRAQLDEAVDFGSQYLGRAGSEDFARTASNLNPAQREVARVSARDAVEARGNTPAGAAGMLDDLSVGRGRGQRSDALLGDDAVRLQSNADYARRELEAGRNISPRTGSQTNDNQQTTALANGAADAIMIGRDVATGNKAALAVRATNFLRQRGFNDQEAEALLVAGLDRSRTQELIEMFQRAGTTRRDARNAARSLQWMLTPQAGASQR